MNFWRRSCKPEHGDLAAALGASHAVAVREASASQAAIASSLRLLEEAREDTDKLIRQLRGTGDAFDRAREQLRGLSHELAGEAQVGLAVAETKIGQLRAQAEHFSVALFGRTMAGKSTVREALTRGDGSTIGQGAQNTTRKTQEYSWNRLRVLVEDRPSPGHAILGLLRLGTQPRPARSGQGHVEASCK